MKKRVRITLLAVALLIVLVGLFSPVISAKTSSNVTKQNASDCLNQSDNIMNQMIVEGFNVIRVNDSIKQARMLYNSQVILFDKKLEYDFSPIISYCGEIKTVRADALSSRDEFAALLAFYNDSVVPGMNTTSIDLMIDEIRDEIKNERYEKVKPLVDSAYNEIINVKSAYTALNLFLDSTTRSLAKFFLKTWKVILAVVIIAVVLFVIYRLRIMKWLIQRDIFNLELRKKTIKELIMKTQKDYFETGKIPENEYNIKIKKFAELIRDIDRQIPLLREELVKLERLITKKR